MRTFKGRLLAVLAGIAVIFTMASVPGQTASADQYWPEKAVKHFRVYWNNVNDPAPTYCTHYRGGIKLKFSKKLHNGDKACDFSIVTDENGVIEKTKVQIFRHSKYTIDVRIVLSKTKSRTEYRDVNSQTAQFKYTASPWALRMQYGSKSTEWLPNRYYKYTSMPAKNFNIGVKYKITQRWVTGPYKNMDPDIFLSRLKLKVYVVPTK